MANGWFKILTLQWFSGWFGEQTPSEPVDAPFSVSFSGTSSASFTITAPLPVDPTVPQSPFVGGYERKRRKRTPDYKPPQFIYPSFNFEGSSTFATDVGLLLSTRFSWQTSSAFVSKISARFTVEPIAFEIYGRSKFKAKLKATKPKNVAKVSVGIECVEIDLLEEEELALLLSI